MNAKLYEWMSSIDIYRGQTIINHLGNPDYPDAFPADDLRFKALFYVLKFVHRLDLARCYTKDQFIQGIKNLNLQLVSESPTQRKELDRLLYIADQVKIVTGCRRFCVYWEGMMLDEYHNYDLSLYYKASTNVSFCAKLLQPFEFDKDKIYQLDTPIHHTLQLQ